MNALTRLQAALQPLGVPVLLPEEREHTNAGRKPGQPGGLAGYLQQHPSGFVQLELPQGISTDGRVHTYWLPVTCVASTPHDARALTLAAHALIAGDPVRNPTAYAPVIPPAPLPTGTGFAEQATYETQLHHDEP